MDDTIAADDTQLLTILTQLWAALVAVHVVGALQLRLAKVAQ